MNRNDEWMQYIQEIQESLPPGLTFSAEKAVARVKNKARISRLITIPVAGVCVAAVALTAVCNTSKSFAQAANSHPFLHGLARALTISPSLRNITAAKPRRAHGAAV